MSRRITWLGGVGALGVLFAGAVALAALSERSETVEVGPGEKVAATPECGRRQRVVSAGFDAPGWDPSGARISVWESVKQGPRGWRTSGDNFSPSVAGDLVGYAYCERGGPRLRRRTDSVAISATEVATARCEAGERLVSGGFTVPDLEDNSVTVSRSHKVGQGWEAAARVSSGPVMTLVAHAYCSERAPRLRVVEATTSVAGSTRGFARATCPRGRPLVAGGFVASEPPDSMTVIRSRRAGRKRWQVGAHALGGGGGSITAEAYCGRR